jgi:hypothetical protein
MSRPPDPRYGPRYAVLCVLLCALFCAVLATSLFASSAMAQAPADPDAAAQAGLRLQDVRQYYVLNKGAGEMLVVEGMVANHSDVPRQNVMVTLSLISDRGRNLGSKQAPVGSRLNLLQLATFSTAEIELVLDPPGEPSVPGRVVSVVPARGATPFMLAVPRPTWNLGEWAVAITGFETYEGKRKR